MIYEWIGDCIYEGFFRTPNATPYAPKREKSWLEWAYQHSPSATTISRYNLLLCAGVMYQMLNDTDASMSEYGSDFAVHFMSFWLSHESNISTVALATFLNLHRMTSIVEHLVACDSTIPLSLNVIDLTVNHTLNLFQVFDLLFGSGIRKQIKKQDLEAEKNAETYRFR